VTQALSARRPAVGLLAAALALNAAVGLALAREPGLGTLLALVPLVLLALVSLVTVGRALLVFAAFAIDISGVPELREPLASGLGVTAPDLLVLFALGGWLLEIAVRPADPPRLHRTPVLGVAFGLFACVMIAAILRGHLSYGAPLLGQPLRFLLYAGIAAAMTGLRADQAYRGIVAVFYVGALWKVLLAVTYLVTGFALQEQRTGLSTAGDRALGLTSAIYLVGAFVLALLNVELTQRVSYRIAHLAVAGIALFGVTVTYGRAAYIATALVLVGLLLSRPRLRAALLSLLPLAAPALVLAAIAVPAFFPDLVPTAVDRVTTDPANDASWRWRQEAYGAILGQFHQNPLFGVGFGQGATFSIDLKVFHITQDPHNSYLFLLGGGGAAALGAFAVLLVVFAVDALRRLGYADTYGSALIVWSLAMAFVFVVNTASNPQLTQPASLLALWTVLLLPSLVGRKPTRDVDEGLHDGQR
jgi:O-antigen ligase